MAAEHSSDEESLPPTPVGDEEAALPTAEADDDDVPPIEAPEEVEQGGTSTDANSVGVAGEGGGEQEFGVVAPADGDGGTAAPAADPQVSCRRCRHP